MKRYPGGPRGFLIAMAVGLALGLGSAEAREESPRDPSGELPYISLVPFQTLDYFFDLATGEEIGEIWILVGDLRQKADVTHAQLVMTASDGTSFLVGEGLEASGINADGLIPVRIPLPHIPVHVRQGPAVLQLVLEDVKGRIHEVGVPILLTFQGLPPTRLDECECLKMQVKGTDESKSETAGGDLEVPPLQRVKPLDPDSKKTLGKRNARIDEPRIKLHGALSIGWVIEVEATVKGDSCRCTHFQQVQATTKEGKDLGTVRHHTGKLNEYAADGKSGYNSGNWGDDDRNKAGQTVKGAERPPKGENPVPKDYLQVEHGPGVVRWVDSPGAYVGTPPYEKKAKYRAVVNGATTTCECTWEVTLSVDKDGQGTVSISKPECKP